jgi:SAM-dependent methyltransferase
VWIHSEWLHLCAALGATRGPGREKHLPPIHPGKRIVALAMAVHSSLGFAMGHHGSEPPHLICRRFLLGDAVAGERVLDVGCGEGQLVKALIGLGCAVVATEIQPSLVAAGLAGGLDVRSGRAEALPFEDNSFDRVLCSVVVPYTDERLAVSELARVVKPGGQVQATYHGVGYALQQIVLSNRIAVRLFGARTLLNTYYYWATGRRLPGFWGDTLCQGTKRLASYYRPLGVIVERELIVDSVGKYPRFICHQLRKVAA